MKGECQKEIHVPEKYEKIKTRKIKEMVKRKQALKVRKLWKEKCRQQI